jgi:hypothetical protein
MMGSDRNDMQSDASKPEIAAQVGISISLSIYITLFIN